jgi:hypothetical protein
MDPVGLSNSAMVDRPMGLQVLSSSSFYEQTRPLQKSSRGGSSYQAKDFELSWN